MDDLIVARSDDLSRCHAIRRRVFIEEQNVPEELEVDGRDGEAIHLLARLGDRPVGTARILVSGDVAKIGRVAVLPEHRGGGIGRALMLGALDILRAEGMVREARLGSQTHAAGFYTSLGFATHGDEFMEAGIPHVEMRLTL